MLFREEVVLAVVLPSLALAGSGCGKPFAHIVKDVKVRSYEKGQDVYAEAIADLDLGAISLPAFELPVTDPRNPSQEYGSIAVRDALDGKPEIALEVNVTEVSRGQLPDDHYLPNGSPLPVGGLDNVAVAGLRVGGSSKVYVAAGSGVAMLGFALVIGQFDQIGHYLPPIDYFDSFKIGTVDGEAGVFMSPQPAESGLALFVDGGSALGRTMSVQASDGVSGLTFGAKVPGKLEREKIERGLYKLHRKRAQLRVE